VQQGSEGDDNLYGYAVADTLEGLVGKVNSILLEQAA
jgi:hypothetical protein